MGSKLKMKAPKKNRVLACDNQMSQAFARAMQNSRKELEIMQDQAYNDGFNTGDDWANTINSVKRGKINRDNMIEEIADVLICIEMLKQMYMISDEKINKWIEKKQAREAERMKKNE